MKKREENFYLKVQKKYYKLVEDNANINYKWKEYLLSCSRYILFASQTNARS